MRVRVRPQKLQRCRAELEEVEWRTEEFSERLMERVNKTECNKKS